METIILVKVTPNASKCNVEGWQEGILRIRIRAVPEKGRANEALIAYLSEMLDVSKSALRIISGQSARIKRVSIEGLTIEQIKARLDRPHRFF